MLTCKCKMELILLILVVFIIPVKSQTYFITPDDNEDCDKPCFRLNRLSKQWSRSSRVNLFLLPGTHNISQRIEFSSYVDEFNITPLNTSQEVKIHCQGQAKFVFRKIQRLNIVSLNFTACTLEIFGYIRHFDYIGGLKVADCIFIENSHKHFIITKNMNKVLIQRSSFISGNGAIACMYGKPDSTYLMKLVIIDTTVRSNWGNGSALYIIGVNLAMKNSKFINNMALLQGGAIFSHRSSMSVANSLFEDNHSRGSGGAIYFASIYQRAYFNSCHFYNNSANDSGGAILSELAQRMHFLNVNFTFNKAGKDGGAMYCKDYLFEITRINDKLIIAKGISMSNSAKRGGFAFLLNCTIQMESGFDMINNTAMSTGGAVHAVNSKIVFNGSFFNISYNSAENNGGALFLTTAGMSRPYNSYTEISKLFSFISSIRISPHQENHTKLLFDNNAVTSDSGKGGAIYVEDGDCVDGTHWKLCDICFVYEYTPNTDNYKYFVFTNNRASLGSVLYGGSLDRCIPHIKTNLTRSNNLLSGIDAFKANSYYKKTPLAISSDPVKACICAGGDKPDCSLRELNVSKMRGEVISVALAAVNQDGNPVPSTITAAYNTESVYLEKGERSANIFHCSVRKYHMFTVNDSTATLVLEPDGLCKHLPLSLIKIHINIAPCSNGFEQDMNTCVCERRLKMFNIATCIIETHSVERKGSIWLKYDEHYLKIHSTCPLDYCNASKDMISVLYPDDQCANHRSGTLCGGCRDNYSIIFGGSRCLKCTSKYSFIWLTLLFILAGIALVTLLLICNLTISHGSLNGLIFYANVISISGLTSLNNCSIHPILAVFIAWINLDLGIETCFYPGMDVYAKTWLQFVFPLYVWLLVAAIIVASYYSSKAMKVFGRNNIAILATLFLLSYNKILKTIITSLTFTEVLMSKANNVLDIFSPYKVWTFDGNVAYVKGKHIFLFAASLALLVLLVFPYTFMITFGQWFRSLRFRKGLRWIHNITFISIMDAYHAPYNKRHRYWTGLMLLTRCFLFLFIATNYKDNALLTNMYTISLVVLGIMVIKTFTTKIYKNFHMNTLELCFLINLDIVSATLYYLKGKNERESVICACVTASISVSLIMFTGILSYHAYLQIRKTRYYFFIKQAFIKLCTSKEDSAVLAEEPAAGTDRRNVVHTRKPTTTLVELRESLLESVEMKER